jgi:hypothetical protein
MTPEKTPENQKRTRTPKCPICREPLPYDLNSPNPPSYFPFCSRRCKLVDLHKWLSEEYSISSPIEPQEDEHKPPSE